jgi:FHS family glucose/mannose:H+ symporter-like MFS transporter
MKNNPLVFYAACLGMLLFGMVMVTLGSILPSIVEKFHLAQIEAGSLVSILPFGILAGSLLFGPIVDRYGYKALLITCALLVLLGMEGIAYAENISTLNIAVFFIGFGGGVLNGATNALVADISDETKGANLSLLGVFYGLGALGMPTVLNILKNLYSTEGIIASVGGFIFVVAISFFFVAFPKPKLAQGFPIKDGMKLLKSPALLMAGIFLFFTSGMEGIANNWMTSYLEKVRSIDSGKALFALSLLAIALTVSRLLMGRVLKLFSTQQVFFTGLFIGLTATIILYFATNYVMLLTGIVMLGIGMSTGFPLMLGYVAELFSNLSGTAFSIVLVMALIGNMLINYSMGVISETNGMNVWPLLLIICLGCMILSLWIFLALMRKEVKTKS